MSDSHVDDTDEEDDSQFINGKSYWFSIVDTNHNINDSYYYVLLPQLAIN